MPEVTPMYRIRQVNGHEEEIVDTLTELHHLTFFGGANVPEFDKGHWWLAFRGAPDCVCRPRRVHARRKCGIFLPGGGAQKAPGPRLAIAADARLGIAGAADRMAVYLIGHHR